MPRKNTQTKRVDKEEEDPQAPNSVPVFFHAEEIGFLINALRNLPISGTPDNLAQVLPLVQNVRMKIAQAGVSLGMVQQTPAPPLDEEAQPSTD